LQIVNKERNASKDGSCYLSHNCPFEEATSLAMTSHPQFYPQVSMHSNNQNFLAKFVGRMHFGVQTQTKPVTP
jgi:hypothetical protein